MDAESQQSARKYVFENHEALWRLSIRSEAGAISKRGDRHLRMLLIQARESNDGP
jgi:hypothetical protein